ncbi:hypothetical protein FCM35_KLT04345 [Carex littledalei]|uniref:Uncharacterized protein n=1 Tax=Carex littledalei TaxID=544730 RepID=A0A833R0J3_9POAL|nr:hypothetical protein FCM35_KLT04345 [Carex littledalei]
MTSFFSDQKSTGRQISLDFSLSVNPNLSQRDRHGCFASSIDSFSGESSRRRAPPQVLLAQGAQGSAVRDEAPPPPSPP